MRARNAEESKSMAQVRKDRELPSTAPSSARSYHVVTPLLLTFDHRELLLCRGTLLAVDWTANQEISDASLVLYLQVTLEFLLQIDFYP